MFKCNRKNLSSDVFFRVLTMPQKNSEMPVIATSTQTLWW